MGSLFSSQPSFAKNPSVYATKIDESTKPSAVRTYDYIIIGGGTAACVLAHRLTEDPTINVLMIEAGKSHKGHLYTRMPATFTKTLRTNIDWQYTTTKQVNAADRSMYWPAAKVVGGGSMINALVYQRPCADDIMEWARLGATGWSWENDFQKYLNKAEKYTPHPSRLNSDVMHRGGAGHWLTCHPKRSPICENFVDACEQVGIPKIMACRPEGPLGVSFISGYIDQKGQRNSTADAYLTPDVLARRNLTVAVETTVTKILFTTRDKSPHAEGVELAKGPGSPLYQVYARREVLCCAGAIKTPQILIQSGVGPIEELKRLNISVVKALPAVGKNLCDHLAAPVSFRAKPGTTLDPLVTFLGGIIPLLRWLVTGGGPLGMLTGQASAFVKSTDTTLPFDADTTEFKKAVDVSAGDASPDLEYLFAPAMFKSHGFMKAPNGANICTIGVLLLRPQSTGTIIPKSSSIWDGADIDPNYLAVKSDIDTFARGVRLALRIARSKPLVDKLLLQDDAEETDNIYFPGHTNPDKITDDALRNYIRCNAETLYHPMCTARIGQSHDDSVVNHELRVHGVSKLRVIDASVFPAPFAGHPCATVVALAEKAADMLKATRY